jgi:oligoribonuclease (3'-5' exoribonuclease)
MPVTEITKTLESISKILGEKEYQVSYVVRNPPAYAKNNPDVWAQSFYEYLRRQGVKDPERLKVVDNIEWNEVVRIYNTLIGKKNRERKSGFVKKKNKDLIAASADSEKAQENGTFLPQYLVMIDCEMTGVVPGRDKLLQVGMVKLWLADNEYVSMGNPLELYLPYRGRPSNDFQKKYLTHIFDQCNQSTLTIQKGREIIKDYLGDIWGVATPTGDCISCDMSFLYQANLIDRPDINDDGPIKGTFHYEQFDLNPIKLVARQKLGAKPEIEGIDKENIHDALTDCYNQIKELNFYIKYILG